MNPFFPRAVNILSSCLKSSAVQTESSHPGRCDSPLVFPDGSIILAGDRRREEEVCLTTTTQRSARNQSVSTDLEPTQSLFTVQNVAAISDQNVEFREKIVHQNNRIGYLTARVVALLTEIGRHGPEARPRTSSREACVNTDGSLSQGPEKGRDARFRQHVDASPLIAAVKSAKYELAALKRERRNIEGES